MQPFQQRVVDELNELQKKIDALFAFSLTETFAELPPLDQSLLLSQLSIMKDYANVLRVRIDRF